MASLPAFARRALPWVVVAAVLSCLAIPTALSTLSGSGQLTDVVQLSTTTGTLAGSTLASSGGAPAASSSAFTMTNSNSNVDTLIRLGWTAMPYYGTTTSQVSISLRGTTYVISDLLMFKQETTTGAGSTTTSQYFAPLMLNNSANNTRATFTSAGNACTSWTGSAAVGFTATAAGTFTFKYYDATTQTDDTPSTTSSYNYCLDTTNSQVYVGTSASFSTATLVQMYTTDSALATLKTYQFEFLPGSYTHGDKYCFVSVTGSGTSATPDLQQCMFLGYSSSGAATVKLYPIFDPPVGFPSANQAGSASVITYQITGTQWDPYAHTTTNSA
jgi:hypothetical protein